ncbi:MAG: VWA domain-containing protein [Planctomycetota bacterium]
MMFIDRVVPKPFYSIAISVILLAAAPALANSCYTDDADDVRALAERLKSPKDNEKIDAMFDAAKKIGTVNALRLITPFFTYSTSYVSDRAIAAFSEAKNPDAFATVVKESLASTDARVRVAVLESLIRTRVVFSTELLRPIFNDPDEEVKYLITEVLLQHPPAKAPAELVKFATSQKSARIRANALIAAATIEPAVCAQAIAVAQKDKDSLVRVGALLAQRAAKGNVESAIVALNDSERRVRLAALEWIRSARPGSAIAPLIISLTKETGRVKDDVYKTLKNLTLRDFGYDGAAWKTWHDQVKADFVPPPLPPEKSKGTNNKKTEPAEADESRVDTKVDAARYYDFIVRSDRVAFLVDTSGSMRAKYTPPGNTSASAEGEKTRLEFAADALREVIKKLPKGTKVTIIVFKSEPLLYKKGAKSGSHAVEATPELADDVHKFVIATGANQTGNISDSLEYVLDDPEVDTIYLLTDGAPSAGKKHLASRIVAWVGRVTRLSRTEVNTIGFGAEKKGADFLSDLADITGGKFDNR